MGNTLSVPRRSNPWLVLLILLAIYVFNYADRYLISGLIEPIKAEFGVGDRFMGLLMGPAFAVLYTTLGIPIARLADRSSRIAIICGGCLVWSLFTGLSGLATGPWTLAMARIGVGVGEAAFVAPAYALLADYFAPQRRGVAFAILGVATYLGQVAGYSAGPAIAAAYDWRTAFIAMAVPGVVMSGVAWFAVREPVRSTPVLAENQVPLWPLLLRLVDTRSYRNMMFGMGFGTLSGVSFGLWGPGLFARNYGLPMQEAANAFALSFGSAGLIGMLVFGVVSDRLARREMLWPLRLAAGALLSATIFIMIVTWAPEFWMARALAVPSGLMGGGWSIGIVTSLQFLLPDKVRATATALFIMVTTFVGFVLGPWVAGALSESIGGDPGHSLRLGLTVTIATGIPAAILTWRAARTLERDRESLAD